MESSKASNSALSSEASTRASADTLLQSNINNEVSARANADSLINTRIDEIIAPTGTAPNPAEIVDARIGGDGITYSTLGNAIRSQYNELLVGMPSINDIDADLTELNPISVVTNSFVKSDGTYMSDSSFRVLVFDVTNLKRIKIRSYNVSAAVLYVALDANDNVVTYYTSGLSGVHFLTTSLIIPDTVTKIKINDSNPNASIDFGLGKVWKIDKVYDKLNTVGGANDNVIAFPQMTPDIDNTFLKHLGANVGTQLTPTGTTAACFFELYSLNELKRLKLSTMSDGTIYEYAVTPGKTYLVKTYSNAWAFKSWYATDENYIVQSMCEDTPITAWIYRPFIVNIPKGATKLVVNWYNLLNRGDIYKCEVYEIESYYNAGTNHNIGVIGDSMSQKVGDSVTPPNYTDKFWWEILGEKLNCAIGCVAQRGAGFKHDAIQFERQISNLQSNNELVIVFGSGNDMSFYDSTNEYGDITDTFTTFEDSSVAACMVHFFKTWRERYPLVKLVVFSPTLWNGYDPDLNPTNPKMIKYMELLKEVCAHFAVPFIDMTLGSGFTPSVEAFRTEYTVDGTHPNTAGHKFIAPFFIDTVKRILL